MTAQNILNFIIGDSTVQLGMLDKNYNDTHYRAFMLRCLNLVMKDIANRQQNMHWKFLEKTATTTTVASQHTYDLPTDIDTTKLFAIYDRTNDITLKYIPYNEFVRLVADPSTDEGDAIWWTLFATTIRLYPVPDSAYTIYLDYIRTITAATDGSTALDIPDKYESVVIDGCLVHAYKFDPEMGDWKAQQQIYEAGVARMISDNNMMIGELSRSESHRDKARRPILDGQKSYYYPVADPT